MVAIVDQEGKRLGHRKLECNLAQVAQFLAPYKERLEKVAVESTYNWYWLVDGLAQQGYPMVLANPAKIEQYRGLKHGDDTSDAYFIAELMRLGILPTAHIYDAQLRPVRDLLRRRMSLVGQRTALLLSFKSLYARTTGQGLSLSEVKGLKPEEVKKLYEHPANQLIAGVQKQHVEQLTESIEKIEKVILKVARTLPYYEKLKTMPGIGLVLGQTITMEVGDIKRFPHPGHFASYCRTVDARRLSNGKQKAQNNQKCGNRYLAWAFVEAANFARRSDSKCRQWFDRKAAKTSNVIATKALACKLAKAAWFVMSEQVNYDENRMFPELAQKKN
jgi:transposase